MKYLAGLLLTVPVLCSELGVSSKLSNYLHTLIISSLSAARGKALAQPLFLVTSNINLGLFRGSNDILIIFYT